MRGRCGSLARVTPRAAPAEIPARLLRLGLGLGGGVRGYGWLGFGLGSGVE